jgi:hypothetical protein
MAMASESTTEDVCPGAPQDLLVEGELLELTRSRGLTTLLACTGVLVLLSAVTAFMRFALKLERRAELRLAAGELHVSTTTRVLGRTIRSSQSKFTGGFRVSKESHYPMLGFTLGLACFFLGTALGVSWILDGVRAASGSLLVLGALLFLLAIAVDYAITTLGLRLGQAPRESLVVSWTNAKRMRIDMVRLRPSSSSQDGLERFFGTAGSKAPAAP